MKVKTFHLRSSRFVKSDGVVLLLIVLALLVVSGAVLFMGIGANIAGSESALKRTKAGGDQLQAAKQMLIGYVISPPSAAYRPGTLPTPDSLANGSYDGSEDSQCLGTGTNGFPLAGSAAITKRCLGRLPWKALGFEVGLDAANDPTGSIPWLAVSANLVDYNTRCLFVLNSESAKLDSPATPVCPGASAPPYPQPSSLPDPWLTVVDANGAVLSNRVAAVLIMPGPPIATETRTQQRSATSPPSAYIDDIKVPLGCTAGCTTFDNAGLGNVFIAIPPGTKYPPDAQDVTKRNFPIAFNDQLIYITIDDLIPFIERRVAGQMAASLRTFKANASFSPSTYPWLAPFNAAPSLTNSVASGAGTIFGMFPFMSDTAAASRSDYRTDFDWAFTGFLETLSPACRRIRTGPSRWVRNTLTNSIAAPLSSTPIANGTVPLANGVCQWRGVNRVSCSLAIAPITTTFPQTMTIYSDNTCTTVVGTDTLNISRDITTLAIDASCASPAPTYIAGSGIDVHRWSSTCPSITPGPSSISLAATDTIKNTALTSYTLLPTTVSVSLLMPAGTMQVVANRMRYHPTMPGWFHENLWYRTAFAAVAPAVAPASNPCANGLTTLTAGAKQGVEALVIQAGAVLPGINLGTRPTMAVADYLEGTNLLTKTGVAPGMTNCIFDDASAAPTALANDQLIVVSP